MALNQCKVLEQYKHIVQQSWCHAKDLSFLCQWTPRFILGHNKYLITNTNLFSIICHGQLLEIDPVSNVGE